MPDSSCTYPAKFVLNALAARIPDIASSVVNTFTILVKARPAHAHLIFGALTNWTPNLLSSLSAMLVKSVEKMLRLALVHLLRSGHGNAYAAQINDFLHRQDQRMRAAQEAEIKRKEQDASHKRQRISDEVQQGTGALQADYTNVKRRKLEDGVGPSTPTPPPRGESAIRREQLQPVIKAFFGAGGTAFPAGIADFDVTALPVNLVMELVIANLQVIGHDALDQATERARWHLGTRQSASMSEMISSQQEQDEHRVPQIKVEEAAVLDPLNIELDDDDLEARARAADAQDRQSAAELAAAEAEAEAAAVAWSSGRLTIEGTNEAVPSRQSSATPMSNSTIDQPSTISSHKLKSRLLHSAIGRICSVGMSSTAAVQAGGGDKDLWIQLISRLVTRGLVDGAEDNEVIRKEKNAIRKQIFDFVTADLSERIELARLWLNEEWYTQTKDEGDARPIPEVRICFVERLSWTNSQPRHNHTLYG